MSGNGLEVKWRQQLFGIRRSVRYNERRRLFFERWNRVTSASAVLFGSAAMASLLKDMAVGVTAAAAAIVTILSTIDLVVGTGRQAWLHADLTRRFITLEQEMSHASITEANFKKYIHRRLEIEKDEPPVMHVLNLLCHNELLLAEGYGRGELYNIGLVRTMVANFLDIDHHSIIKLKDSSPV